MSSGDDEVKVKRYHIKALQSLLETGENKDLRSEVKAFTSCYLNPMRIERKKIVVKKTIK